MLAEAPGGTKAERASALLCLTMEERFGPWRLGRRIAVGDLADVSEAVRDDDDGPTLALKRLHAHSARDPEVRALFARECQHTLALPPHPGLIRGVDAGAVGDRPWLAVPLGPGDDLRRRLDGGAALAPAVAAAVIAALLDALAHLHAHDCVHGDVNPANLLLADVALAGPAAASGTVVLCDLGVSRPPGEPGPVRGTHAYMAPEQVRGEPWTAATDVFAAGVILWELLAGRRLFKRDAHWLTLAAVVEEPAPPLGDDALDPVLARALAKAATARFTSAGAFADALRALRTP